MNHALRRLTSMLALLLVAAAVGVASGYVYAHDPQRDVLTVNLEAAGKADPLTPIGGTVIDANGGRLRLNGSSGSLDLTLPASARIEELRPLPSLTPGVIVNVGVERSDSSTAVSGIVVIEGAR